MNDLNECVLVLFYPDGKVEKEKFEVGLGSHMAYYRKHRKNSLRFATICQPCSFEDSEQWSITRTLTKNGVGVFMNISYTSDFNPKIPEFMCVLPDIVTFLNSILQGYLFLRFLENYPITKFYFGRYVKEINCNLDFNFLSTSVLLEKIGGPLLGLAHKGILFIFPNGEEESISVLELSSIKELMFRVTRLKKIEQILRNYSKSLIVDFMSIIKILADNGVVTIYNQDLEHVIENPKKFEYQFSKFTIYLPITLESDEQKKELKQLLTNYQELFDQYYFCEKNFCLPLNFNDVVKLLKLDYNLSNTY